VSDRAFSRYVALASVVGALHALAYVPLIHSHETADTPSYTIGAKAILHGSYTVPLGGVYPGGAADITGLPLPPALRDAPERYTYRAPGYPLFLAALGGGEGRFSRTFVIAAQTLLLGLTIFLVARTLRNVWGPRVAAFGAWAYALDPFSKRYVSLVLTEILAAALVAVALYCFVRAWQGRDLRWWGATGAVLAAATLVRPVFAFTILLAAVAALLREPPLHGRVVRAFACAGCAAVVLAPWIIRNVAVTGSPVIAGFGSGWALETAAHGEGPRSTWQDVVDKPSYQRDWASMYRYAPPPSALRADPEAHPRYLLAADRELRRRAWSLYGERVRHEPLVVAEEYAYRAYFLWMAHEDWYQPSASLELLPLRAFDWLLLALASVGGVIAVRRGGAGRAIVFFLAVYTATSALVHVEARYTYPLRGIYLTLAVYAALHLAAGPAGYFRISPRFPNVVKRRPTRRANSGRASCLRWNTSSATSTPPATR
jgi:hypothetical protein